MLNTLRWLLCSALCAIGLLMVPAGCVDFAVDEEQYICRAQEECGGGFACLRGPSCYCTCQGLPTPPTACASDEQCLVAGQQGRCLATTAGAQCVFPNPACQDQFCQNVQTQL